MIYKIKTKKGIVEHVFHKQQYVGMFIAGLLTKSNVFNVGDRATASMLNRLLKAGFTRAK